MASNGVGRLGGLDASHERKRIEALRGYQILDTEQEEGFDRIVRIAQASLDFPIALISFVGEHRLSVKAKVGLEACGMDRDVSFCTRTIEGVEPLIIPDTVTDDRFRDNPFVTGDPFVRSYWGSPLILSQGYPVGSVCVLDRVPRSPTPRQISILQDLAQLVVDQMELRLIATFDALTGAKTRGAFLSEGHRMFAQSQASSANLSCILLDIDHFKAINDRYGHAAGDHVLRSVMSLVQRMVPEATTGRLGGEEFAVLLPCAASEAARTADQLREAISNLPSDLIAQGVTASFGVTERNELDRSVDKIIERADQALYLAKRGGRNRVHTADP